MPTALKHKAAYYAPRFDLLNQLGVFAKIQHIVYGGLFHPVEFGKWVPRYLTLVFLGPDICQAHVAGSHRPDNRLG